MVSGFRDYWTSLCTDITTHFVILHKTAIGRLVLIQVAQTLKHAWKLQHAGENNEVISTSVSLADTSNQ